MFMKQQSHNNVHTTAVPFVHDAAIPNIKGYAAAVTRSNLLPCSNRHEYYVTRQYISQLPNVASFTRSIFTTNSCVRRRNIYDIIVIGELHAVMFTILV